MTLLNIQNVSAAYGAIQALHNVNVHIDSGEIVALIGANGAGKSTLLMSLFNQPRPTSGTITFCDHELTTLETHQIAKLGIAQAPEGRRIFPKMRVEENLMMGATAISARSDIAHCLEEVFQYFPILKTRRDQIAGTLSGGEQQMLAIGRALMSQPKLLLLDEPSLGLAPKITQIIFEKLRDIVDRGTTLFLVEQNANYALNLCDRAYVLRNGAIELSGTGDALLKNEAVRAAYLGA